MSFTNINPERQEESIHADKMKSQASQYPHPSNSHVSGKYGDGSGVECSGKNVLFMKTSGWLVMRKNDEDFEFISSESECIKACALNLIPRHTQFWCASAQYNARSHVCLLSKYYSRIEFAKADSDDDIYYEKLCIPPKLAKYCPTSVVERQPQRVLLTYANALVTATSLHDCVKQCLVAHKDNSLDCRSLIFLYQDEEQNCLLSSGSRKDSPEAFITENEIPVDYVGFDDCFPSSKLQTETSFRRLKDAANPQLRRSGPGKLKTPRRSENWKRARTLKSR